MSGVKWTITLGGVGLYITFLNPRKFGGLVHGWSCFGVVPVNTQVVPFES